MLGLVWNIVLKFHIAPTLAQKGPPEKDFLLWLAHKDICISKLAKYALNEIACFLSDSDSLINYFSSDDWCFGLIVRFSDSNLRSLLFALRPNLELGKGNVCAVNRIKFDDCDLSDVRLLLIARSSMRRFSTLACRPCWTWRTSSKASTATR